MSGHMERHVIPYVNRYMEPTSPQFSAARHYWAPKPDMTVHNDRPRISRSSHGDMCLT